MAAGNRNSKQACATRVVADSRVPVKPAYRLQPVKPTGKPGLHSNFVVFPAYVGLQVLATQNLKVYRNMLEKYTCWEHNELPF